MSTMKNHEAYEGRAGYLAREALAAQLQVLQGCLPMTGWLVARHEGQDWQLMATAGNIGMVPATPLAPILMEGVPLDGTAAFEYRRCHEGEVAHAQRVLAGQRPSYLFRAGLTVPGAHCHGAVLGLQHHPAAQPLRTSEITSCLSAMLGILQLHAELLATERLVLETRQEAWLDPLTRVLNRIGWDQYVQHIDTHLKGTDADAVVGIVDLDFLKSVNERAGHAAGDELLKRTAQTIHAVLRRRDCVARLGGDEFAILLQDVAPADAAKLKERLTSALQAVGISVAFGLALKSEGGSLKKAFALADARMYAEKRKKPGPPLKPA